MDTISPAERSRIMARIRSKDTKPELAVRSALHRIGFRFRLHCGALPGRPDIVLPRYRTVILVQGCFWHRHPDCRLAYFPKSRQDFWRRKFAANVERDRRTRRELRKLGWHAIVVWECQTTGSRLSRTVTRVRRRLERASSWHPT
jgi:DNA mismatch endonuclease (patch repair protein)